MVSQIGMGCLPGTTSRPRAPMIAPTMIAVMMPVTVTVSSSSAPGAAEGDPSEPWMPDRAAAHPPVTEP
jgi:hypothetical protein